MSPTPTLCRRVTTPRSCRSRGVEPRPHPVGAPVSAFAAVDLGASSGRVIVGTGRRRAASPCTRSTGSRTVRCGSRARCTGTCSGCTAACSTGCAPRTGRSGALNGVGIDSWAVDHGLLDRDGALLGNPVHYRDARTDGVPEKVFATVPAERALRPHGPAGAAVQHRVPAGRGAGHRGARRCPHDAAGPGPARLLADGRPGGGGDQRVDDRPARRDDPDVGDRPRGAARDRHHAAAAAARPGRAARATCAPTSGCTGRCRCGRWARTTPRPPSSPCRPSATTSRTSPAARGRSSASSSTGPVLTEESRGRQLHQRGGGRRHRPVPAQRHGAVGAPGVDAHVERGRPARGPARPARRRRPRPAADDGCRPRRPGVPAARRHARPHRRRGGPDRPDAAAVPGRDGPVHPRLARAGVPAGRPPGVARSRTATSASCTWSAGECATSCCASSPRTRPGCRWSPDPSRGPRSATCWCRRGPPASCPAGCPSCGPSARRVWSCAGTSRAPPAGRRTGSGRRRTHGSTDPGLVVAHSPDARVRQHGAVLLEPNHGRYDPHGRHPSAVRGVVRRDRPDTVCWTPPTYPVVPPRRVHGGDR